MPDGPVKSDDRPSPWPEGHVGHWWSGWPGAYCLRCGAGHALECAIGNGWYDLFADTWDSEEHRREVEQADGSCPADRLAEMRSDGS